MRNYEVMFVVRPNLEDDATGVLLPVYLNSGSLVNLPTKKTLFITSPNLY